LPPPTSPASSATATTSSGWASPSPRRAPQSAALRAGAAIAAVARIAFFAAAAFVSAGPRQPAAAPPLAIVPRPQEEADEYYAATPHAVDLPDGAASLAARAEALCAQGAAAPASAAVFHYRGARLVDEDDGDILARAAPAMAAPGLRCTGGKGQRLPTFFRPRIRFFHLRRIAAGSFDRRRIRPP